MGASFEHEVAVDFIADDDHSGLAAQTAHLGEGLAVPLQADGVMGVAQYHHAGLLALDCLGKALKVHAVVPSVKNKRILDHNALVALDNHAEGMVDGRLNQHLVALRCEIVDGQADALHHTRDEREVLAGDAEAVAALLPFDD